MLPAVPTPGSPISADQVVALEYRVAETVSDVDSIDEAEEWRAQAAALESYLRSKGLHGPMLGAQRRIEARIGQLLGKAQRGGDRRSDGFQPTRAEVERDGDRHDFRVLACALAGECALDYEQWRRSRRTLVAEVKRRLRGDRPQETPPLPTG